MSFVKLNQNNFAMASVVLNADRKFVSSSSGVTGALKVIVDRSHTQKDNIDDRAGLTGVNTPQPFGENTYEGRRKIIMEWLAASGSRPSTTPPSDWYDQNSGELELAQLLDGSGVLAGTPPPEYEKYGLDPATDLFSETGYSDISMHPRNSTELLIRALKPSSSIFSSGSMALAMSERVLEPNYRVQNSAIGSKFVNFNCMNFFEASSLKPVLMYHTYAPTNSVSPSTSIYDSPTGDFSIEFWIKIKDTTKTGTVLHYPGRFSVSVLSGSEKNERGFPTNYGIGLAYGSGKTVSTGDIPFNLDYGTDSNTEKSNYNLKKDVWYHVAVTYNYSTKDVKFYIDGSMERLYSGDTYTPSNSSLYRGLFIGGYYSGTSPDINKLINDNQQGHKYSSSQQAEQVDIDASFECSLNADIHEVRLWNKTLNTKQIKEYMHTTYTGSYSDHQSRGMMLYVPCLYDVDYRSFYTHTIAPQYTNLIATQSQQPTGFRVSYDGFLRYNGDGTENSRSHINEGRRALTGSISSEFSTLADIFNQPAKVAKKQLAAPYNTHHANIGNFANMNIQSFLKDYATIAFPYCIHLSESFGDYLNPVVDSSTFASRFESNYSTNHLLTSSFNNTLGHQARNCFILPCDNGTFRSNYQTIFHRTGSKFLSNDGFYINTKDIGDVADLFDTRLFFVDDVFAQNESFLSPAEGGATTQGGDTRYNSGIDLFSVTDEDPTDTDIPDFAIPSADDENFAEIFDSSDFPGPLTTIITIPQLYYGRRLKPGSIKLSSYLYNGSQSRIELRDNGYGTLYRHQASGSIADWNKVGDVFYGEGLIYIRHPSLYAFSDNEMEIEFKSESQVNVFEASIPCTSAQFNSSSNPNYNKLKPSANDNESSDEFVYISTVYLHDDNLNVIGKAKLSQPVIKRPESKYLFRVKLDY